MGREQDLYSNPQGKPVSESRSNPTPASSTGSCPRIWDTNFPSPRASGAQLSHSPARKVFPMPAKKKKRHLARAKLPKPVPPVPPQPFLRLLESPSAHRCHHSPGTTGQAGRDGGQQ